MSARSFSQLSITLLLVIFISGCASPNQSKSVRQSECRWNPSSCMYEGSYEPDEREYAEQQAKDLNKEASRKLRRRSIWSR